MKKKVKNKAHVEGSICQAYLAQEFTIFAEHYFESNVSCKSRRLARNDEGASEHTDEKLSIFNYPGRAFGRPKVKWLTEQECHAAHSYVL